MYCGTLARNQQPLYAPQRLRFLPNCYDQHLPRSGYLLQHDAFRLHANDGSRHRSMLDDALGSPTYRLANRDYVAPPKYHQAPHTTCERNDLFDACHASYRAKPKPLRPTNESQFRGRKKRCSYRESHANGWRQRLALPRHQGEEMCL